MNLKKVGPAAGVVVAAGAAAVAVGVSNAEAFSATPAAATATTGYGGTGTSEGSAPAANHTAVTGDELAKVTAAVVAKDSAVNVTSVRKDGDGSYDVFGTKAGASVGYEVSAHLAGITADSESGSGHKGGGSQDVTVNGDEAAQGHRCRDGQGLHGHRDLRPKGCRRLL